jgi:type I restriction enzyme R subunit
MSPPGKGWNEANLSEDPAIRQLVGFGYSFIGAETLELERESLKEVVLTKRLAKALKKLNPWLSDDNVHNAVRAITAVQATSLIRQGNFLATDVRHYLTAGGA